MKSIFFVCVLVMLSANGRAQTFPPEERLRAIAAKRLEIYAERATLESGFRAEDAACNKNFAVNLCLNDVKVRRSESVASLRRQEILLNDEERQIKGDEQIRKTEEKSSPEKQREAADRAIKANEDHQSRLERENSKQRNRKTAVANENLAVNANAEKLLRNQRKAIERGRKQAAAAEQAKKYADRQIEAKKRQAEHDADRAAAGRVAAKPLPLPTP